MLVVKVNPVFSPEAGGVTISGSVSNPLATVKWKYENDTVYTTNSVVQSGAEFYIDFRISSNIDVIIIQAVLGEELSAQKLIKLSSGNKKELTPSFIFNEFDELGLKLGLTRLPAESNDDFRSRMLNVYSNPGNTSKLGVLRGVERELGLPHMNPFFYIGARWSPLLDKEYERVFINFKANSVSIQLKSWYVNSEIIEVDNQGKFTTNLPLGMEFLDDNIAIRIFNGDKELPSALFTVKDGLKLDIKDPSIDLTSKLYISYPYKKVMQYAVISSNEIVEATVADVIQFLQEAATVLDENLVTKPLVNIVNGLFSPIDFVTGMASTAKLCIEDAWNNPPLSGNINVDSDYYSFTQLYPAKSLFSASSIIPTFLELTDKMVPIQASWISSNTLHDEEYLSFLETLDANNISRNLTRYAEFLRDQVHMGINKSIVNRDFWGSDSPDIIGDNFLPSKYDGGIQDYKMLSDNGSIIPLSLSRRKFLAKQLVMSK